MNTDIIVILLSGISIITCIVAMLWNRTKLERIYEKRMKDIAFAESCQPWVNKVEFEACSIFLMKVPEHQREVCRELVKKTSSIILALREMKNQD